MDVIRGMLNIRERHRGCVVMMGDFAGVHPPADIVSRADDQAVRMSVLFCLQFNEQSSQLPVARFVRFVEKLVDNLQVQIHRDIIKDARRFFEAEA